MAFISVTPSTAGTVLKTVAFTSDGLTSAVASAKYSVSPPNDSSNRMESESRLAGEATASNYMLASYQTVDNAGRTLRASAVRPDRASSRIATSGRALMTGSKYMLTSYQTEGDTRTVSSPSAVIPDRSTTTASTSSSTTPMNVYLYAGDQIIENVTMGYFYY